MLATVNRWSTQEKAAYLAVSLKGEEMRLKVRQSRPKTLREALLTALELESFHLASRQRTRSVRGAKIDCSSESEESTTATKFQKQMLDFLKEGLQQVLAQCSKTGDSPGQPGHMRRNREVTYMYH